MQKGPTIKELIQCIKNGEEGKAHALIAQDPTLCAQSYSIGLTPLIATVFFKEYNVSPDFFNFLLQHPHTDVNAVNKYGAGVVHFLTLQNRFDLLHQLLESKKECLNINALTNENLSSVYLASEDGAAEALGLLLQKNANIKTPNKHLQSPLHVACLFGQKRSGPRQTPIEPTTLTQYEVCISLLLNAGADPNASDATGSTPTHYLASADIPAESKERISKLFEEYGANSAKKSQKDLTPGDIAAQHYDHAAIFNSKKVPPLLVLCIKSIQANNPKQIEKLPSDITDKFKKLSLTHN